MADTRPDDVLIEEFKTGFAQIADTARELNRRGYIVRIDHDRHYGDPKQQVTYRASIEPDTIYIRG